MGRRALRNKKQTAPEQAAQQLEASGPSSATINTQDEVMCDASDADMGTGVANDDGQDDGGQDDDGLGDLSLVRTIQDCDEFANRIAASTDNPAQLAIKLADAAPISRLAAMAAVGANGNTSQLYLAASTISLQQDLNMAFSRMDDQASHLRGELNTEVGFTESQNQKLQTRSTCSRQRMLPSRVDLTGWRSRWDSSCS
ncbi:hypothetical protein GE09DRAFT_1094880 [Coniochaeta sp. 2T2.1]|nr:hypothetical protein GE09DRAFT_1094880 [Coniochaeta sp. 2T2.1]